MDGQAAPSSFPPCAATALDLVYFGKQNIASSRGVKIMAFQEKTIFDQFPAFDIRFSRSFWYCSWYI